MNSESILKILKGKVIFDLASKQRERADVNMWFDKQNKRHNWINLSASGTKLGRIAHGHATIHRSVLNEVLYQSEPLGEDAIFIRNLLKFYKRRDDTILWVDTPLSYYISAKEQNARTTM